MIPRMVQKYRRALLVNTALGQLARILGDAGCTDESRRRCQFAAARYDEPIATHPEAFAHHAVKFWLFAGADPTKALRLARMNFDVRQMPRPCDLLNQAVGAAHSRGAL